MKNGVVRKTFIFSSLLITLVVLLSFTALYFVMPSFYLMRKEHALQTNLTALAEQLRTADTQERCAALIAEFVQQNNADILAFSEQGELLPGMSSPFVSMQGGGMGAYTMIGGVGSSGDRHITLTIKQGISGGFGDVAVLQGDSNTTGTYGIFQWGATGEPTGEPGADMKVLTQGRAQSISTRSEVGGEYIGYLTAAGTLQPIDEAQGVVLSLIPYVLLGAVMLGLVLAGVYSRQISKPIIKISQAAVRMREMQPDAICDVCSNDELGELSGNLNELYTKLLENIDSLKAEMERVGSLTRSKTEMMQSAGHELKTPIAALGGMLEGMIDNVGVYRDRDKYLIECKGQVDRLSKLVWEILNASRDDHQLPGKLREVADLDRLVRQCLEEHEQAAAQKRLEVLAELSPCRVVTDQSVLSRALHNLVSNAVRHSPDGGKVRILLNNDKLTIENTCEPIPQQELEKLFEPFYTRSASRDKAISGTGLGLYIVKRSLEQLGMQYEVSCNEANFSVTLLLERY